MRELNTVAIAMTDYGFWDIEPNTTNDITYTYRGKKKISYFKSFFEDESKLIRPSIELDSAESQLVAEHGSRFVEYDDLWAYTEDVDSSESELTGYWTSLNHPDGVRYWDYIIGSTENRLDFNGGTQNFGVYSSEYDTYIDVLVNLELGQFKNLLFANPVLVQLFVDWLYRQVVHSGDDELPAFGEYYLYNNHVNQEGRGFIGWLGLESRLSHPFKNVQFNGMTRKQVNQSFSSMVNLIEDEKPKHNTLQGYCSALYRLTRDTTIKNAGWLVDGGEDNFRKILKSDFGGKDGQYESTYKDEYVRSCLVDGLIAEYPLLRYFRDYLIQHLETDLSASNWRLLDFADYGSSVNDSIKTIRSYLIDRAPASLVIGGYTGVEYPGLDAYLQ